MLQKTYSIYCGNSDYTRLFVETGKNHIACWCKKDDNNTLSAFEFFQFDDASAKNFEALINNVRQQSQLLATQVAEIFFFWNTDEVLCLPNVNITPELLQQNFDLMKGNQQDAIIYSAQIKPCTITWRIENNKQQTALNKFEGAVFTHQFVALLPYLQNEAGDIIYLFFYPHYFTMCAFKQGSLQYLNNIKYNTPEDVLYFILNVCKQYDIEKNVAVQCGGFIDEKSKLYETLYQYLEGFELLKAPAETFAGEAFGEYSSHYFMPYINYVV